MAAGQWLTALGNFDRITAARAPKHNNVDREADPAYHWWIERDRPGRQRFHPTITRERQWVWLDDPANAVSRKPDA